MDRRSSAEERAWQQMKGLTTSRMWRDDRAAEAAAEALEDDAAHREMARLRGVHGDSPPPARPTLAKMVDFGYLDSRERDNARQNEAADAIRAPGFEHATRIPKAELLSNRLPDGFVYVPDKKIPDLEKKGPWYARPFRRTLGGGGSMIVSNVAMAAVVVVCAILA
jgi:hypothetical protein